MRTREMTYDDYGISPEEREELRKQCRSRDEKTQLALLHSAYLSNCEISDELYYSLRKGISYERLCIAKDIPINRNDFYAYQMKTIALFKVMMDEKKGSL